MLAAKIRKLLLTYPDENSGEDLPDLDGAVLACREEVLAVVVGRHAHDRPGVASICLSGQDGVSVMCQSP